jgi:hypothetical protein
MGATHQALLMHGGAGGGGGGWTPLDLFPGSVRGAWWDPSDLSTLWQDLARTIPVTTTGQSVAIMDDKSGNGMELVQGVSGARPILQNDGTNYYLDFDGTDDFLSYNTGSNLRIEDDDINVVFGMKTDTTTGYTAVRAVPAELGSRSLLDEYQQRHHFLKLPVRRINRRPRNKELHQYSESRHDNDR